MINPKESRDSFGVYLKYYGLRNLQTLTSGSRDAFYGESNYRIFLDASCIKS